MIIILKAYHGSAEFSRLVFKF